MNNYKLNDKVQLLIDLIEGMDFVSSSKQNIKKGSIGVIVDVIDDSNVSLSFHIKNTKIQSLQSILKI